MLDILGRGSHHPGTGVEYGDPPWDFAWFRELSLLVDTNAIDISSVPGLEVCVLLPVGSMFNHSCNPNVQWTSAAGAGAGTVVFKTTRAVEAGEELRISYVSAGMPVQERQEQLMKWGFVCRCTACVEELQRPAPQTGGDAAKQPVECNWDETCRQQ